MLCIEDHQEYKKFNNPDNFINSDILYNKKKLYNNEK